MIELDNYENQNAQKPTIKPKKTNKKQLGKSFLAALLIFVVVGTIVGKAVYDTIYNYSNNFNEVLQLVDYLNEPVDLETLVLNPVTQTNYDNFEIKANAAGFGVFNDGVVDLEQETITLSSDLTLTDSELAAFINQTIANNDGEYSDLFTILELSLTTTELTTIARLDFSSVQEDISQLISNFPNYIYITTVSEIAVANNVLLLTSSNVQINQLEQSKNDKIVTFLDTLFNSQGDDYTFTELVTVLVSEQLFAVTSKTSSYLVLQNGAITFSLTEPVLETEQE